MVTTDKLKSIWVCTELFLQAFYRLGDLLNARMRGMAPELMVRLLMRWTENGVTQCLMPMFPGRYFQPAAVRELPGSAQLCPREWGQVHITGCELCGQGRADFFQMGTLLWAAEISQWVCMEEHPHTLLRTQRSPKDQPSCP